MQYTQTKPGRIFVLRLEQGEIVHKTIEDFARNQHILSAMLIVLGGIEDKSRLVTGPEDGTARPVTPITTPLTNVHETLGTGTIFPDKDGQPILHLHLSCGRKDRTLTGCSRAGVITWQILEVIILELTDCPAKRILKKELGFKLLDI